MYADYGTGEDGAEEEDEYSDYQQESQQTAPLRTPTRPPTQLEPDAYEGHSQARQPWDERGKTGLYGGGGRGADDRETGWVSDYAFSPAPNPGFEEDLQFEDEGEEVGPKERKGSRGSRSSRATQGRRSDGDERRRSSAATTQSSYGPITPISTHFNPQQLNGKAPYADSGYRSAGSPPASDSYSRHAHSNSSSSTHHIPQHRAASPVPPVPTAARSTRVSPPPAQAVHTVDPTLVKKKATTSTVPVPSAPMPLGSTARPALPSITVDGASSTARRKSGTFKWGGRSKKAPVISAPILPEGFVESLGMETFALTPGCKPPQHGASSPLIRANPPDRTATPPVRVVSPPSERAGTPPSTRKAAPRPQQTGKRPQNLPLTKLGATSPYEQHGSPPSLAAPVRLPLDALHDDSDAQSGYNEDVLRRLSKDSDASYAVVPQSNKTTHRQYFDGLRQDHSRHEEVQANRSVIPHNAPGVPPTARHHDSPSYNPPATGFSPQASVHSAGSANVNGFRDPWSAPAPTSSSSASIQSQRTNAGNRDTYYQGYTGGDRTSMASTVHEPDFRKGAPVRKNSYVSMHSRVSRNDYSPEPAVPSVDHSHYQQQQQQQHRDDRNGSVSSAYSSASEAPPANDFHPRAHPGFNPMNAVGHLRKNSIAGLGALPLPLPSSSSSSRSHSPSQLSNGLDYAPVAPLNLGRRPSHVYGSNKFGGDVVWGGAGVGGPKDVASPIIEQTSPPVDLGATSTIGSTGFRNPFG